MCVLRQQGGRQQDNLSFCIFMLLESVRTGSPLLPQIKIIRVLILSLEVIFQEKKKKKDIMTKLNSSYLCKSLCVAWALRLLLGY